MYKLFIDLKDGSNHVFYQNGQTPHLWLLAMNGKREINEDVFCDNLMDIASKLDDELFTTEVATLIAHIKTVPGDMVHISGPSAKYSFEELQQLVDLYDYEQIFGTKMDKIEFYVTDESKEYFKEYQKTYRAQYRSITSIIIVLNVIVFVINMIFGYSPYQFIFGGLPLSIVSIIPIFLAGFTQFSFFHIFFNMSFLQSMGPLLEKLLGKWKFVLLYFVSMFVSGIFVIIFTSGMTATAGASGALYGLFGYFLCYVLKYGTDSNHKRSVTTSFVINILFTLMYPGISIAGHIGGAITGAVFFLIDQNLK